MIYIKENGEETEDNRICLESDLVHGHKEKSSCKNR